MGGHWLGWGVLVVALGACGPAVEGGEDGGDDGESSSDEGGSATGSGSASGSSTGSGSATGSGTGSDSASEGDDDSGSADGSTTTGTTTDGTFTDDGPPPPEGGEIGEGGDCSCCGSSLHVSFPDGLADFTVWMSSQSEGEITVQCPEAIGEGLDADTVIQCGVSEFTLVADGLLESFDEELWTVTVVGSTEPLQVESDCEYGLCDCNCQPTDCELSIPSGFDDG